MTGPVPRVNGKPDLSGIWQAIGEPRAPGALFGSGEFLNSKYFRDILSDFKRGEEPLTPEGEEILRRNTQPGVVGPSLRCLPDGVPHADLLPEPFKIIQTPREALMLYEVETIFRQIYTDGRKLPNPDDVRPTWYGYSVGTWDGDTFVVDTLGFNDLGWLDAGGHGHPQNAGELRCLVDAGLTPMQALRAGTQWAAQCVALEREIGTLEKGRLADLVVVHGNPLADITVLLDPARIELVLKGGAVAVDRRPKPAR